MPEGKYVEFGEMKRVALQHAVDIAKIEGHASEVIVDYAEKFYLFLIDT